MPSAGSHELSLGDTPGYEPTCESRARTCAGEKHDHMCICAHGLSQSFILLAILTGDVLAMAFVTLVPSKPRLLESIMSSMSPVPVELSSSPFPAGLERGSGEAGRLGGRDSRGGVRWSQ